MKEQVASPVTVSKADVQSTGARMGQYLTEKPFHKVVAFYVHKSGMTPPNWSILGREFPGTAVRIPAHFSHTNVYREKASVTLLHYIREEVATVQLLVTDHPQLGFVSVSITRGKNDTETLIQLIQHPSEGIQRSVKAAATGS